ncbi:MAG: UDP-N-acetylglucosamine 2-epimerase (non-hydrolyzing) [Bryobacter sp.]|nr:UDP-N-acetylglucosamine 2-epimerase (non-hydrolyzing) [Bryobacter sp.]
MLRVLVILGTRPEAIKLAPLVQRLRQEAKFAVRVCSTGQHREMVAQALGAFGLAADLDLGLMLPGQTLFQSTSRILASLEGVFREEAPSLSIVQGDTNTTFAGALASFYARVPVAHVEAGLRTGDLAHPFPEEANRLLTARLARYHFAATPWAAENLRREGVATEQIWTTGNTGVDALFRMRERLAAGLVALPTWDWRDPSKRLLLVTGHRRENFGEGFLAFARALRRLAERGDVQICYPVHPNPNVREPVEQVLGACPNVVLIPPQDYVPFLDLMQQAHFIITDSGGVQEEGPSLGKPILVTRKVTERPEAVEAGTVRLVGTDEEVIVAEATRLLDDEGEYQARSRLLNPYGDGQACERIAQVLRDIGTT